VFSVILALGSLGCGIKSAINTAVATVDTRAADAIHSRDNAIAPARLCEKHDPLRPLLFRGRTTMRLTPYVRYAFTRLSCLAF